MNKVGNIYWGDPRLAAQRVIARELIPVSLGEPLGPGFETRTRVRARSFAIPSWVVFTMVLVALFAMSIAVNIRSRVEMVHAAQKLENITVQIEKLKQQNGSLKQELRDLQSNPRVIESAARARLNMVRPNEVVLAVD